MSVQLRTPRCHSTNAQTAALTLKLADGTCWVLPWGHFLHGRHSTGGLSLAFATWEVEIHGRNLVKLLEDIGQFRLEMVRELPGEYAATVVPDDIFISGITVKPCAKNTAVQ